MIEQKDCLPQARGNSPADCLGRGKASFVLLAHMADFGLPSLHNHVSQLLNKSLWMDGYIQLDIGSVFLKNHVTQGPTCNREFIQGQIVAADEEGSLGRSERGIQTGYGSGIHVEGGTAYLYLGE